MTAANPSLHRLSYPLRPGPSANPLTSICSPYPQFPLLGQAQLEARSRWLLKNRSTVLWQTTSYDPSPDVIYSQGSRSPVFWTVFLPIRRRRQSSPPWMRTSHSVTERRLCPMFPYGHSSRRCSQWRRRILLGRLAPTGKPQLIPRGHLATSRAGHSTLRQDLPPADRRSALGSVSLWPRSSSPCFRLGFLRSG